MSGIGGILGMFLGFSVLTIGEFLELGVDFVVWGFLWLCYRDEWKKLREQNPWTKQKSLHEVDVGRKVNNGLDDESHNEDVPVKPTNVTKATISTSHSPYPIQDDDCFRKGTPTISYTSTMTEETMFSSPNSTPPLSLYTSRFQAKKAMLEHQESSDLGESISGSESSKSELYNSEIDLNIPNSSLSAFRFLHRSHSGESKQRRNLTPVEQSEEKMNLQFI